MITKKQICLGLGIVLGMYGMVGGARLAESQILSLDQYLGQVKTTGPAYSAAEDAVKGFTKQKVQTDLMYSPQLVAHVVHLNDREEQTVPELYGDKTVADDYGVALVKKWKYGFTTALNYGWTRTEIDGSSFLSSDPIYQVRPSASVTLPLGRDFLGRQTRSQMDKNRYLLESAEFTAAHQKEGLLYQARVTYWRLQLARKEVEIRQDTLKRAESLVAWSEKRVRANLVDDSEALQARAARQVRAIELKQALENEKSAQTAFNRFRGAEGKRVLENLADLDSQATLLDFRWPQEAPVSWEVRASAAKIASDKAAWKDATANACPDIDLFASYAGNGLDSTFDPAHVESTDGKRPTTKVGAQVVIPLDVFTAKKAANGYEWNYRSSEAVYKDKLLQTRQSWERLKERLEDVNTRLEMVTEIETIQKQKVIKEREQLGLGRSTQFQMQTYETDYAMSRLQRQAVLLEKLALWAEGEWLMAAEKEDAEKNKVSRPVVIEKSEVAK